LQYRYSKDQANKLHLSGEDGFCLIRSSITVTLFHYPHWRYFWIFLV